LKFGIREIGLIEVADLENEAFHEIGLEMTECAGEQ